MHGNRADKDTATLKYEIYSNHDQSENIVLDRYPDSDTLSEHSAHIGDLMGGSAGPGVGHRAAGPTTTPM
jgi:hypothetical protein